MNWQFTVLHAQGIEPKYKMSHCKGEKLKTIDKCLIIATQLNSNQIIKMSKAKWQICE